MGTSHHKNATHTFKTTFGSDDQSDIPIKYIKRSKHDKDAKFYFFISSLLILFMILTIIASLSCVIYFVLKSLFPKKMKKFAAFGNLSGYPEHVQFDDERGDPGDVGFGGDIDLSPSRGNRD